VPSCALAAGPKRGLVAPALVGPQVPGNVYWLASRSRKLPEGTESFSAFLKDYMSALVFEPAPRAAQAA